MKTLSILFFPLVVAMSTGNISRNEHSSRTLINDHSKLYDTLACMDSLIFDAFNNCRYDVFNNMLSPDLEFFHDKSGLTNYASNVEALKNKCKLAWKIRRELVPGSLEVYPVPGYGAIQVGTHRFYNTEKGPETLGGTFKFLHIWKRNNGNWQLARVASYDH
jgi:hypothetical protein